MTEEKTPKKSASPAPVPPPRISDRAKDKENHEVPEYLKSVYDGRYFHPLWTKMFDDEWAAALASFFMGGRLTKLVTNEIFEGQDVLQLGLASGSFEYQVASKMNGKGKYRIEDISPAHIEAIQPRISPWLNVSVRERDFTIPTELRYDVVICYFLLHELPDVRKTAAIRRALGSLKPGGRAIFIDYAAPVRFHPLKYPLKWFNRLYEPFAESLWHNEIESFAPKSNGFIWAKKTLFGNMYQCVIAQKK